MISRMEEGPKPLPLFLFSSFRYGQNLFRSNKVIVEPCRKSSTAGFAHRHDHANGILPTINASKEWTSSIVPIRAYTLFSLVWTKFCKVGEVCGIEGCSDKWLVVVKDRHDALPIGESAVDQNIALLTERAFVHMSYAGDVGFHVPLYTETNEVLVLPREKADFLQEPRGKLHRRYESVDGAERIMNGQEAMTICRYDDDPHFRLVNVKAIEVIPGFLLTHSDLCVDCEGWVANRQLHLCLRC